MKRYPLIFGLRDLIEGEGFVAGVVVEGRALVHEEDDGSLWIEGVNPGGFSAVGESPAAALEDFRRSYRAVLFDIASDAASFEEFQQGVQEFFDGAAEIPAREWLEAVEDVRAGRVDADWLGKQSADSPTGIKVKLIWKPSAENNAVEEGAAIAA